MILYKWTDKDNQTRGETQWGEGVTHTADGQSAELCNSHWLHAYKYKTQAVVVRPAHVLSYTKLWKCEGEVGLAQSDKVGCISITTLQRTEEPELTTDQFVATAIRLAMVVYDDLAWRAWAIAWLSGEDRSKKSAKTVANAIIPFAAEAYAAHYAAYTAVDAAHDYAACAAYYAADAVVTPAQRKQIDAIWRALEEGLTITIIKAAIQELGIRFLREDI